MEEPFKFDALNTSYVSLAALIRHLRENQFTGRLHVSLDQYETDVFLYGSDKPSVWENDHAAGREGRGDDAMQRLLVRSREPGGVITLFQGSVEFNSSTVNSPEPNVSSAPIADHSDAADLREVSSEIIAAVERAVESSGASFREHFQQVRVEVGDDYSFLDPTVGGFEYKNSKVTLEAKPSRSAYVAGVSEALKRVVNRVAPTAGESAFRERVAVELAITARRFGALGEFKQQLDRIAGTRVL